MQYSVYFEGKNWRDWEDDCVFSSQEKALEWASELWDQKKWAIRGKLINGEDGETLTEFKRDNTPESDELDRLVREAEAAVDKADAYATENQMSWRMYGVDFGYDDGSNEDWNSSWC